MKINVRGVTDEGLTLSDQASAEMLGITPDDMTLIGAAFVSVTARKVQNAFHVSGHARATIRFECARCLKELTRELSGDFDMIYKESIASQARDEAQVGGGDLGITYFTGNEINVAPEVRQCLLLERPMRVLCKPECRGLCPQCGQDLNAGPCRCGTEAKQEPPAGLDTLMKKWGARP